MFLTSIRVFRIRLQRKHTVSIAADSMCQQNTIGKGSFIRITMRSAEDVPAGSFKFRGNLAKTPLTLYCP